MIPNRPEMKGIPMKQLPAAGADRKQPGRWAGFAIVFCLVVASRLPFLIGQSFHTYRGIDEMSLTLAGADRFLGVPFTNTHWPGATNQLLLVPVFGVDYLVHAGLRPSPAGFIQFLSSLYRSPWQALFLGRLVVVLLSSAGFAVLATALADAGGSVLWGALLGLLLAATPQLWLYSVLALGNGIGIGFLCAATAVALGMGRKESICSYGRPLAIGALIGLALASRNILLPYLLFLCVLVWLQCDGGRVRRLWSVALVLVSGFVVLIFASPSMWSAPVRWAKANLGNYLKHGSGAGIGVALHALVETTPYWLLAAAAAGVIYALRQKRWLLVTGAMSVPFFMVAVAARAPEIAPRYFQSVPLDLVVFVGLVFGGRFAELIRGRNGRSTPYSAALNFTAAAVAAGLLLAEGYAAAPVLRPDTAPAAIAQRIANLTKKQPTARYAVNYALFHYLTADVTNHSLKRLELRCAAGVGSGDSVRPYLASYGFAKVVAEALPSDFNEKEQAFLARLRVMDVSESPGRLRLSFFAPAAAAVRFGLRTRRWVYSQLKKGRFAAVFDTAGDVPADLREKPLGAGWVEAVTRQRRGNTDHRSRNGKDLRGNPIPWTTAPVVDETAKTRR